MPIDLYYHPISPPSRAVLATARYLGIEVNVKTVDVLAGGTRTPQFLKLNPSHTVPTIVDGDDFALFESRAILMYLAAKGGDRGQSLYPSTSDSRGRAQIDMLLYFDASGYYPALTKAWLPLVFEKRQPTAETLGELREKIEILDQLLGDKLFFTNNDHVTIADISIATSAVVAQSTFPKLWPERLDKWYQRVVAAIPQIDEVNRSIPKL